MGSFYDSDKRVSMSFSLSLRLRPFALQALACWPAPTAGWHTPPPHPMHPGLLPPTSDFHLTKTTILCSYLSLGCCVAVAALSPGWEAGPRHLGLTGDLGQGCQPPRTSVFPCGQGPATKPDTGTDTALLCHPSTAIEVIWGRGVSAPL